MLYKVVRQPHDPVVMLPGVVTTHDARFTATCAGSYGQVQVSRSQQKQRIQCLLPGSGIFIRGWVVKAHTPGEQFAPPEYHWSEPLTGFTKEFCYATDD